LPLGGLGEVGMNCMAFEQRGEILLVDCGVTFDDRRRGVDVVHPDFRALDTFGSHVVGVVITHGHEDHIGALPYLLKRFDTPIWAPPYALGLIRERLGEHEVLAHARLLETRPRTAFAVGSFGIEPIRVTHSIADATALAIRTDAGTIIHTGDFKFDEAPPDGEHFDTERLSELGDAGVSLLLSDSTNIDAEGPTGNEVDVGDALAELVVDAQGAVVVSMFASNIHRLRLLGDIARKTGRKIVLLGRGVGTHARVARSTGYLPWPDDLVWSDARVRELPRSKVLAIATGSQGEERAALAKLARGDHPAFDLAPGDRVVLSARTIPGNEREVYALINELTRRGCDVRTRVTDRGIHVSGHAHRPEQRRMLELVRPKHFIPVHGTIHHLTKHGLLASDTGVESVKILENGRIASLDADGTIDTSKTTHSGRIFVWAGKAIPPEILREREVLAEQGVASCVLTRGEDGEIVDVDITTRGVFAEADFPSELEGARAAVKVALRDQKHRDDAALADEARLAIRRAFFRTRGQKPMTIVHVVRRSA
jgi:ribonuclease J